MLNIESVRANYMYWIQSVIMQNRFIITITALDEIQVHFKTIKQIDTLLKLIEYE